LLAALFVAHRFSCRRRCLVRRPPRQTARRARDWVRALSLGCSWVLLPGVVGCDSQAERARRSEATALVRAIEGLRDAPNPDKRPRLLQLEQLPCSSEDLCELKRICSKAYQRHQRALDSARSLRHALRTDGGAASAASAKSTADLVSDAQRYLKRARFLTRRCTELTGEISRRYDL
jgi:hypothetical protein